MIIFDYFPRILFVAALIQGLTQAFKLVFYSLRDKRWSWKYLVTAGGIPSAHTAFVTALTTGVAVNSGPATDVFAMSFVFSAIIIYDAYRLRGTVQDHSKVLNALVNKIAPGEFKHSNEMIGHSKSEIIAGLLVGIALSLPLNIFLK